MIKVFLLVLAAVGIVYFSYSNKAVAANEEKTVDKKEERQSSQSWHHAYFFGISRFALKEVSLNQQMTQALIRMIGVNASISTGALVNPKYMINPKGVTPWLAMDLLLSLKQPESLADVAEGKAAMFVPNDTILQMFQNHSNWPQELFDQYDIELEGFNVFILPFMVTKSHEMDLSFKQSMKAPDGSLEIFGVDLFDEDKPEKLLERIQGELQFIRKHRPDVFGH